jgi:hypothetical protein
LVCKGALSNKDLGTNQTYREYKLGAKYGTLREKCIKVYFTAFFRFGFVVSAFFCGA